MYSREQLQGILLTVARPELTIYPSQANDVGYIIRLRVMFRASMDFINALDRTFEQYNIVSNIKEIEGSNRKKPVLVVGRRLSIKNMVNLIPNVPTSHADWTVFKEVLIRMEEGQHLEQEGMDEIILLVKGNDKQTSDE
tara:strand:+ start:6773 stop:7189 length:417 start_codon:yes stop_codon:yes gene_type:complete